MKSKIYLTFSLLFLAILAVAQAPCNNPIVAGLVGYYPFCQNANDVSGQGNNGVVTGATLTTDRFGYANCAYSFNGTSDYITLPSGSSTSLNITGDFTLCFWLKTTQGSNHIISFGDVINMNAGGYLCGLNDGSAPTNKLGYSVQGVWHNSTNDLNDNTWHFAVIRLKADTLRLYVDGLLDIQNINVLPPLSWNGARIIGARNDNLSSPYMGILDDISIYNRALTVSEINTLYSITTDVKSSYATSNQIEIYPNPVTDKFNINIVGAEGEVKVDLYNLQGQKVKSVSIVGRASVNIDIADLNSGIYFCKITSNSFSETKKIVIAK